MELHMQKSNAKKDGVALSGKDLIRKLKVELKHMNDGDKGKRKRLLEKLEYYEELKFCSGPEYYSLLPEK